MRATDGFWGEGYTAFTLIQQFAAQNCGNGCSHFTDATEGGRLKAGGGWPTTPAPTPQ